jgi:hypothetical protein
MAIDKWQIGHLRVVNLAALSLVAYWLRSHLLKVVAIEPFVTLGKASLHVFCTHVVFVFVGLALLVRDVGEDVGAPSEQLHGFEAITLLVLTFVGLILVAIRQVRKRRTGSGRPPGLETGDLPSPRTSGEDASSGNNPQQGYPTFDPAFSEVPR